MIKKVEIELTKRTVTAYEYTHYAFKTSKGTFTLSGSNVDGTDEWRQIGTSNFYTWERRQVCEWFIQGKITPLDEANSIDWYTNTFKKRKPLKTR